MAALSCMWHATKSAPPLGEADFEVAIPSYRREHMIEGMTLSLLERHGVPRSRVHIFVADEEERARYEAKLGGRWPNIVTGVPGLWRQRNFIARHFPEGCHVVSLDDDVEEIMRLHGHPQNRGKLEPLHDGGLLDLFRDAGRKMRRYGVFMWSLNVSDNPFFMGNQDFHCAVTLRSGLCNGFFWGCLNRQCPELQLQHGDGHEDVERTCRYLQKDGSVLRYREFCAKTKCHTNAGGIQASFSARDRKLEEIRSGRKLVEEFPLLLKLAPDGKLGVKFLSVCGTLRRLSILSPLDFMKASARRKLGRLAGSRCVILLTEGGASLFQSCQVEAVAEGTEAFGLTLRDGRRLCVPSRSFLEALQAGSLFLFWAPEDACTELALPHPHLQADELPTFLRKGTAAEESLCRGAAAEEALGRQTAAQERSDFARYLDSLVPGESAERGEDEDDADGEAPWKAAQASRERDAPKSLANVCKKRGERHEDLEWIENQRALLSASSRQGEAGGPAGQLDLLADCQVDCDGFEAAFARLRAAQAQEGGHYPEGSAARKAVASTVLCSSRIWGGSWGGQCTKARLMGSEYCKMHSVELQRQGYLTHGRIDGPIPPKKRKEFEKWQSKLRGRQENAGRLQGSSALAATLGDADEFCEDGWRSMSRGASESARAYEYRTGIKMERSNKRARQTGSVSAVGE